MGIIGYDAKALLEARISGVSFHRTLTVGKQSIYLHPSELRDLWKILKRRAPLEIVPQTRYEFGEHADRFCREFLGVAELDSIDYSAYEGATITHDLNRPVPNELKGRFDAIIEAGTLEHVFNFPVAIGNLMEMLKVGGHLFMTTVANNLFGHGFYQFSAELMYRIFAEENGFKINTIKLLEATFPGVTLTPIKNVYSVVDPEVVKGRVGLRCAHPVLMAIEATKTATVSLFVNAPLQSDYVAAWSRGDTNRGAGREGVRSECVLRLIRRSLPAYLRNRLDGHYLNWVYSLANRKYYRKL